MSKNSSYAVERFGHEQEPVVIIDDFHSDYTSLRRDAAQQHFQKVGEYYPGLRARANPNYLRLRMSLLIEILKREFGCLNGGRFVECAYSLVTTPREALKPIQSLPHCDSFKANQIALLHFLSDADAGGTAFFRHKETGFETITESRAETYNAVTDKEYAQMGPPAKNYVNKNTDRFEVIGVVDAKPNRCILYRGYTLHSGCIPDDFTPSDDPTAGRLTINSFFHRT